MKNQLRFDFTFAFCPLSLYYYYKEMLGSALILLMLRRILGVVNYIRKTFYIMKE